MAAVTAMAVTAGVSAYSANRQSSAARRAGQQQARGVENAQAIQQDYTNRAVDQLGTNFQSARDALNQGQNRSNLLLDEAGNILSGGYDQARGEVQTGFGNADQLLQQGYGDAINTMRPAFDQGQQSQQLQAALSGALGPQAQQEAYSNYTASPGQEYLRNQQEQALLRNATALGGGLGAQPAVMQALQENAFGLAQSDFNNSFSRLSEISGRGDNAARSISALQEALGTNRSGIQQSLAQILAGMSTGQAGAQAGILTDRSNLNANAQQGISNLYANQGTATSNAYMGSGSEQAQLAQNLGQANSAYNIYQSQNNSPLVAGLLGGAGAYAGMGGGNMMSGMGGLFGGNAGGAGATQGGYTGSAYQNWVNQQRGY